MSETLQGRIIVEGICYDGPVYTLSVDLGAAGLCTMRYWGYRDRQRRSTGRGEVTLWRLGYEKPFIRFKLVRLKTINKMAKNLGFRKLPRTTDDRRRGVHHWEWSDDRYAKPQHIDAHHPSRG